MGTADKRTNHGHGSYHVGHGARQYAERIARKNEPMTPMEAVRSLLVLGKVSLDAQDYDSAAEAYASALKVMPDATAAYNLASLYARGLGVKKNYLEAARLFHQAELMGNRQAGKLCSKCMLDFISIGFILKRPMDVYTAMCVFVARVYPEAESKPREVSRGLYAIASTFLSKGEHADAAKVFRAAAEFANDGTAQYCLGELYETGEGVEQNDLAALYWFDCAADNGVGAAAEEKRNDILAAYQQALSPADFSERMATLATWCEEGTRDVPANPDKAAYWRQAAEQE